LAQWCKPASPSYMDGWDWVDQGSRPDWESKVHKTPAQWKKSWAW
jgi:hypothetical protein